MFIPIPEAFAAAAVARAGAAGRAWLEALPGLVQKLCKRWQLSLEGSPEYGHLGLVFPVSRKREALALKVTWRDETNAQEALALETWNGNGAVRLLATSDKDGALLLERLGPRSLEDVALEEAVRVAGELYGRLAVAAPPGLQPQEQVARNLAASLPGRWAAAGKPFDKKLVRAAQGFVEELAVPEYPQLINYDLSYENVLAGQRERWLAIDPKVIAGDRAFGLAQLLWCRFEVGQEAALADRLEQLCELSATDTSKTEAWSLVRTLDYWLWGLRVGLTEDPPRCRAVVTWLASRLGL